MKKRYFLTILTLAGALALSTTSSVFAQVEKSSPKGTIVIVLTNHGKMGTTDTPTGFYLSEAAHPWAVFTEAGYEVILASPSGGFAPLDPKSKKLDDAESAGFFGKYSTPIETGDGVTTVDLSEIDAEEVDAIFFAGGHGTMWDFPNDEGINNQAAKVYANGGVVGAVCHGPAALVGIKDESGKPIVAGKKVAVFTNSEEAAVKLTEVVPFLLETKMKELGATIVPGSDFSENVVADQRLVTGQNPASARKAAELVVAELEKE